MNPLRISGEGYGSFDHFDIEIPTGTVAIIGPNGAGKSRLLCAIELALFAGRGELAQWLKRDADRMVLELEFEHDHELYRVRRTYQAGARGRTTVDFERNNLRDEADERGERDDSWIPLTREDADATCKLICQTLGLTRETFGASAFLGQGNAAVFALATPAERKALLGEILDPKKLWPTLAKQAKDLADAATGEIVGLNLHIERREQETVRIPDIEADISRLDIAKTEAQSQLAAAEKRTEEAQQRVVENAAAAERIRSLTEAANRAQVDRGRAHENLMTAQGVAEKIGQAEARLAELEQQAGRIVEIEAILAEQTAARGAAVLAQHAKDRALVEADQLTLTAAKLQQEYEKLDRDAAALADRINHLQAAGDGTERCVTCEQLLGAEAKAAAIKTMQAEALSLIDAALAKKVALEEARLLAAQAAERADQVVIPPVPEGDFEAQLTAARAASERVAAGEATITEWRAVADTIPQLEIAHAAAEAALALARTALHEATTDVPDTAALQQALDTAKAEVEQHRAVVATVTADLVRARQQLEQLQAMRAELVGFQARRTALEADRDVYRLGERWAGRDGIPTLIAENAIPAIEAEANRILEGMPTEKGETLRVELRTQRENKSNDNVRETLEVLVHAALGERAFETYSGGERERVSIALRLALARLLAHRRGAESRVLCLDEPDALDVLGQEQLVDVIASVAGDYDRILVASHAPGIRDAFATVIEISSDEDGASHAAVGGTVAAAEAVPA